MRTPGRFLCRLGALACALATFTTGAHAASAEGETAVVKRIQKYREETWRWQRLMRSPRTPTARLAERSASASFRRWALAHWRREAARTRRAALNPPRLAAWLCIHRHEGPWNANTGNGYYGGLQMDLAFQRRYGVDLLRTKGLAHRWRSIEQIWVAERAYRSGRGFYPWPRSARACGLI
jgi:transglycosylase-like protein